MRPWQGHHLRWVRAGAEAGVDGPSLAVLGEQLVEGSLAWLHEQPSPPEHLLQQQRIGKELPVVGTRLHEEEPGPLLI